jgi:hypothetical protein
LRMQAILAMVHATNVSERFLRGCCDSEECD